MSAIPEKDRLFQALRELEAYEQPVSSEQCDQAIATVVALATVLRQRVEGKRLAAQEGIPIEVHLRVTRELVAYHYAIEQADKARLHLAAFKPFSQSFGERALRKRQIAVFRLREFAEAATEVLARQTDASSSRPRPDYLRLMEPPLSPEEVEDDECGHGTEQ